MALYHGATEVEWSYSFAGERKHRHCEEKTALCNETYSTAYTCSFQISKLRTSLQGTSCNFIRSHSKSKTWKLLFRELYARPTSAVHCVIITNNVLLHQRPGLSIVNYLRTFMIYRTSWIPSIPTQRGKTVKSVLRDIFI